MSRPQRKLPDPPRVHGSGHYKKSRRSSSTSTSVGDANSSSQLYKKSNLGQLKAVFSRPDPRAESPDIIFPPSSRFSRETLITFWDCSISPKRLVTSDGRKSHRQHLGCLLLTTILCLFVAFLIWIVVYMKLNNLKLIEEEISSKESIEKVAEFPKLDSRQLLAALFNRNYFATDFEQDEQFQGQHQPSGFQFSK